MVAILALALLGQIHYEEINLEFKNKINSKDLITEYSGEVSNSCDPVLTIPKKFSFNRAYFNFKESCYIRCLPEIDNKKLKIKFYHNHHEYDYYVDFIGYIDYKIKYKGEVKSGRIKLSQHDKRDVKKHLLAPREYIDPNMEDSLLEMFSINDKDKIYSPVLSFIPLLQTRPIPNRSYLITFEYILHKGRGCNEFKFWINLEDGKTYTPQGKQYFPLTQKYNFLKRPVWNKFTKVVYIKEDVRELTWNWTIEHETEWDGEILIRNPYLIPLDNPKPERGP